MHILDNGTEMLTLLLLLTSFCAIIFTITLMRQTSGGIAYYATPRAKRRYGNKQWFTFIASLTSIVCAGSYIWLAFETSALYIPACVLAVANVIFGIVLTPSALMNATVFEIRLRRKTV
jgi:hypothetical protein